MTGYDSSDLDALDSLVISDGWRILTERVRETVERKRDELEWREEKAAENRGFLAACRMFLDLPKNLSAEIKAQLETK